MLSPGLYGGGTRQVTTSRRLIYGTPMREKDLEAPEQDLEAPEQDQDVAAPEQDQDVEALQTSAALQPEAQQLLDQLEETWRQRVLDEADRIRAARDDGTGYEPVTRADIRRADEYVAGMPAPPRTSRIEIVCQVASYLAAIIAGYFLNNIDEPWGSIGFAITVSIGAAAILIGFLERRKGR